MQRLFIAIVVVIGCSNVGASSACTIGGPPSPGREELSDLVFSGVLESFVKLPRDSVKGKVLGSIEYRFRVGQVWKGPRAQFVTVYSDRSSCGASFEVGKSYFVCATACDDDDSILKTACYSSSTVELALVMRVYLDEPEVVDPELAVARPTEAKLQELLESEDEVIARQSEEALSILRDSSGVQ